MLHTSQRKIHVSKPFLLSVTLAWNNEIQDCAIEISQMIGVPGTYFDMESIRSIFVIPNQWRIYRTVSIWLQGECPAEEKKKVWIHTSGINAWNRISWEDLRQYNGTPSATSPGFFYSIWN
jgi:hypothetical protein